MKKYIILCMMLCATMTTLCGQEGLKNGVYAYVGFGFSENDLSVQSFNMGYQRSISRNLYLSLEFSDLQGSQSFESFFGEEPLVNQYGEIGEIFEIGDGQSSYGRLQQFKVYTISIRKYIQMAPKAYILGGIGVNVTNVSKLDVGGVIFEPDGVVNYENSYPEFAKYSTFGAKVSLESMYFINDYLSINAKAEYLSSHSIFHFSLGSSVSF